MRQSQRSRSQHPAKLQAKILRYPSMLSTILSATALAGML